MTGPIRNGWYFRAPGGETYDGAAARLGDWLSEQEPDAALVVISHGIAGRVLRGLYAGLPPDVAVELNVVRDAPFRLWDGRQELLAPP